MIIFWRLLFGHLLADFTFQTNFINHWKRTSIWGMLAHCATHPIMYAILAWPFLGDVWIRLPYVSLNGWTCVFLVFAVHFIEDQWRVFTIFKYKTPDNTLYFLWDQIIHYTVIFAVIPLGMKTGSQKLVPEPWAFLGCLFVLITHASTVLIYFIEKDLWRRTFPDLQEKYMGMAERLILAMLFLLPGRGPIIALGWFGLMGWARAKRYMDLSWPSYYMGGALGVAAGVAARMVYYS